MNRAQKIAWFLIIAISAAVIVSCIAVVVLYVKFGMPRALGGLGFMGIAGLGGLSTLIFRKDKGKVNFDERDRKIKERATLMGYTASFLFAGMACMVPFIILGSKASISVIWLPQIWVGTFLTAFFVHSVAILVQYGWKDKGEKS